jgi:hypothetical protein
MDKLLNCRHNPPGDRWIEALQLLGCRPGKGKAKFSHDRWRET